MTLRGRGGPPSKHNLYAPSIDRRTRFSQKKRDEARALGYCQTCYKDFPKAAECPECARRRYDNVARLRGTYVKRALAKTGGLTAQEVFAAMMAGIRADHRIHTWRRGGVIASMSAAGFARILWSKWQAEEVLFEHLQLSKLRPYRDLKRMRMYMPEPSAEELEKARESPPAEFPREPPSRRKKRSE